jgi:hypothetical protein
MKQIPLIRLFSQKKGRNIKPDFIQNNILQKNKSKTVSSIKRPPTTSRIEKPIPILSFPLNYNNINNISDYSDSTPQLFLTSRSIYNPLSQEKHRLFKTIFSYKNKPPLSMDRNRKKIISNSTLNKPVIMGKTIEKKIKESKKSQRLKKINILDFGNKLKLYDEEEQKKKEKIILEKRAKELNDIYYDYDKTNSKQIMNSFSGNSPTLLKNKVCFVKGIMDFLYPKLVLQKMAFLNEIKIKKFKQGRENIENNYKKDKYYISKFRNPEQNAALSKYLYGSDYEIIRKKNNSIKTKNILINKCKVLKLSKDYDFI